MMTYLLNIDLWPCALESKDVENHKSQLIALAKQAKAADSHLEARSLARGALYWERWLLERNEENNVLGRVILSLELARDAGDWKEAELLLGHWDTLSTKTNEPVLETWREIVREHLLQQVEHEQRLEIAFQRFRNAQSNEEDGAKQVSSAGPDSKRPINKVDLVKELTTQAREIGNVGSPVAVNNFLARISTAMGLHEEAETHYTALVICRPLWIPYIVQLSEHQAKSDIKRAFRTLETARALLGKDFWLVT